MPPPASPLLSASQLATLAELGEERTRRRRRRAVPRRRPALSVHRDPRGRGGDPRRGRQRDRPARRVGLPRRDEPAVRPDRLRDGGRHASRCATSRSTATCCGRCCSRTGRSSDLRALDLHRAARGAAAVAGRRHRDRRPALVRRRRCGCVEFARSNRLPFTWRDPSTRRSGRGGAGRRARRREPAARAAAGRRRSCARPSTGQVSRALGIGRELAPREEVDLLVVGGRPGRPRRRGLRRLRGPRDARRREHRARRAGGLVAPDRELPRLPGRDHRHGADEPRGHAGAQVRRAHGDAVPRRLARAGQRRPRRAARGGPRDRRARGAARDRRAVPAAPGRAASPTTRG